MNQGLEIDKRDRENILKRAKKEEDTWKLLRLWIEFLEDECPTWKENEEK